MRFTPRSRASWMVAMLSASSLAPYQLPAPIPMHPRAMGNTEGPFLPSLVSFVVVMSSALLSFFEVASALKVGYEPKLSRPPSEPFLRVRARGRVVEGCKVCEPAEMLASLLGGLAADRHVQMTSDDAGEVSRSHALFGDRVIAGSRGPLFKHEPVEMSSIQPMHCG